MADERGDTPDLHAFGNKLLGKALLRARNVIPARVVSFSGGPHPTCSALPLIRRAGTQGDPVLDDVPVAFLGSRGLRFDCRLSDGDTVLVLFCDMSIDEWALLLQTPAALLPVEVTAAEDRTHSLDDGIAIPIATYGLPTQESALALWDELASILQGATVATALGPQPLDPGTQIALAALRARLAAIM